MRRREANASNKKHNKEKEPICKCLYPSIMYLFVSKSVVTHFQIHIFTHIYICEHCFFLEWLAKRLPASCKGQINQFCSQGVLRDFLQDLRRRGYERFLDVADFVVFDGVSLPDGLLGDHFGSGNTLPLDLLPVYSLLPCVNRGTQQSPTDAQSEVSSRLTPSVAVLFWRLSQSMLFR